MNRFKTFTGGMLETNCFFLEAKEGNILFDAPDGADEAFAHEKIDLLLVTHGHFDHVLDAAKIIRRHGCRVGFHNDTTPIVTEREFFTRFGLPIEVEPFTADMLLGETALTTLLGENFQIFDVPGHCPGSLCFLLPEGNVLIGGDVLFRGGVGRADLPGGNHGLLIKGIREKLLPLPERTVVLPGHGPATTIGRERDENPFLLE